MDFHTNEAKDGIRFAWNHWPNTAVGCTRVALPMSCLYTPFKEYEGIDPMEYPPVMCNKADCKSVLNPFAICDFRMKTWLCPICQNKNQFPPHYAENITETQLPFELLRDYTSMEYILPSQADPNSLRPVFMLVVDTAVTSDELVELKDSLQ